MTLELHKRIRMRREELNLSQDELARKVGYKSRSSINKIEMGENDIPQWKIEAFAKALDIAPATLMGWDGAWEEDVCWPECSTAVLDIEKELSALIQRVDSAERVCCGDVQLSDGQSGSPQLSDRQSDGRNLSQCELDETKRAILKNELQTVLNNLKLMAKL